MQVDGMHLAVGATRLALGDRSTDRVDDDGRASRHDKPPKPELTI
jgi:hypothetical protein